MAIAWNELTQGADTTNNPATTASITPTSGAVVYAGVLVAVAGGGGTGAADSLAISGCGLTWVEVAELQYGGRRAVYVWKGTGTPSAGALTITFTSGTGSTWTETMWSIDEVTGADST